MLFNLAAIVGLDTEVTLSVVPTNNDTDPKDKTQTVSGLPTIRQIRQALEPQILDNSRIATNDESLPLQHYKAEHLTCWMMPESAVQQLQVKHGDSEWIEAKLRRVPAKQRFALADEYSARYKAAYDAEPDEIKKANRAAFTANTWLLRATK